jgi:hypothetical protein
MRRNGQYAPSFKFILNIYTWLHNSKKVGFNFFAAGVGGQTITFFMNYATYENCHGHSLLLTKSIGYTVHKKSMFKFFCGRRG